MNENDAAANVPTPEITWSMEWSNYHEAWMVFGWRDDVIVARGQFTGELAEETARDFFERVQSGPG